MRTINIIRATETLMTFVVENGDAVVLSDLVEKFIDDLCKKKYPSYDKKSHSVSYWLVNKIEKQGVGTFVIPFNGNVRFQCNDNMTFDIGIVISNRTGSNNVPVYFMNNLS